MAPQQIRGHINMKNKIKGIPSRGEVAIYRTKDNEIQLEVKLEQETAWLTQEQISRLFRVKEKQCAKNAHSFDEAYNLMFQFGTSSWDSIRRLPCPRFGLN